MIVRLQADADFFAEELGGDNDNNEEDDDQREDAQDITQTIPAIQYLLDQIAGILRREPRKLSSAALTPKRTAVDLLVKLLPHVSNEAISSKTVQSLLVPLQHATDPKVIQPRSADVHFAPSYQDYVNSAHEAIEAIQAKLGDAEYMLAVTAASKAVREKRESRRAKRRIERIAEPEKAARDKRRKNDRKKDRRKEVRGIHRGRRRADLGF